MAWLRITFLMENTARKEGQKAEHGLALWIEWGEKRFLFDTGQSDAFLQNAELLSVPLAEADAVLLSHGHYDHTGGLKAMLEKCEMPPCYLHPQALEAKYSVQKGGKGRTIGMAEENREALRKKARPLWVEHPAEIAPGFHLTGPIPRVTDFEDTGGDFFLDLAGEKPDPLQDDMAAVAETPEGLVVILGCAHSGVVNTLLYVRQLFPEKPVRAVLGGMHLVHAGQERLEKTVTAFQEMGAPALYPCHCTGFRASALLNQIFGDRCAIPSVGYQLEME